MINYKAICDNTQGNIMFRDCNASAESATRHGREHEMAIWSMIQIRKRIYSARAPIKIASLAIGIRG